VAPAISWFLASLAVLAVTPTFTLRFPIGVVAVVALFALPLGLLITAPLSAAIVARRAPRPYEPRSFNRWWVYLAAWLGSMALTQVAIRPYLHRSYQAFRIPAGSMEPALLIGDFLYVRKPARHPLTRGTIVVFASIEEPDLQVIKRVVALTGDTIQMRRGAFLLNGQTVLEPYAQRASGVARSEDPEYRAKMLGWQRRYLTRQDAAYAPDLNDWGPLAVPPDSVFVLGDNRDASYDSRYWGFLPSSAIVGEPAVIYFSYDPRAPGRLRWLTAIRWHRIGQRFP
jgi:signal peptidase I